MKYEVLQSITNMLVENNIEIDKESFAILLNINNFNETARELLIYILLEENIKDKKKFLNYMVKANENTRAMNILLKILKDESIRDNDKYNDGFNNFDYMLYIYISKIGFYIASMTDNEASYIYNEIYGHNI